MAASFMYSTKAHGEKTDEKLVKIVMYISTGTSEKDDGEVIIWQLRRQKEM